MIEFFVSQSKFFHRKFLRFIQIENCKVVNSLHSFKHENWWLECFKLAILVLKLHLFHLSSLNIRKILNLGEKFLVIFNLIFG